MRLNDRPGPRSLMRMTTIEFTTELTDAPVLAIPADVLDRMPKSGRVRVLVVAADEGDDDGSAEWYRGVYQQFARDDSPEDDVYDTLA